MSDIKRARTALVGRILEGEAHASTTQRRAVFNSVGLAEPVATLIDKVAKYSHKVTDEDIAEAKASGLSEDQIFELVICAAVGQATLQYDIALTALRVASEKE
jgi:alkylhydroperoxidase family enzyme